MDQRTINVKRNAKLGLKLTARLTLGSATRPSEWVSGKMMAGQKVHLYRVANNCL